MFLGVSHLILTTDAKTLNIIEILNSIGYEIDFIEEKLKNEQEKSSFLFNDNYHHNITFFKHKKRYAIELIEYKKVTKIKSNILLSFEKKLSDDDKEVYQVLGEAIFYNKILEIEYFINLENAFIFKTNNANQEIEFWNQLGFKSIDNRVNIKSPLLQWRGSIKLIEDDCQYTYMDNVGVNTLCLLTNDINKEKSKISTSKSEIFKMNVNKKDMKNMLIKRDSYNIELLEIK